ncbi:LamG domain-containing protein [Seonamhaeicola maritimus]|uniref:Glycosyl hydrolase n=1 Tax=Seonamhaeicola maritimus TaxID=2591822 RepID=A0A5C7GL66_9FLAO|nr:glycosyl hydrolase [Seonamhaeicola maritimus]TXG39118.1 glycosyl hydrolase [Seonamhaeicola maritimus]
MTHLVLIKRAIVLSLILSTSVFYAQPEIPGKTWKKVEQLSDEFDGKKIDNKKWNIDPEGHYELNWIGRSPALFQKESFDIRNGYLTIEVGKLKKPYVEDKKYSKPMVYKYHGGILRSYKKTSIGHYYECRMKMNKTEMGGGFWLCHQGTCENKHEIDITESVGQLTEATHKWAYDWDQIMHSNAIHRETSCNKPVRDQKKMMPPTKNSERFYTYGFYWKSPTELLFYLDGQYVYTLNPPVPFDQELILQFSIEAYDWNPIPEIGSKVATASKEDRTTYIDYIRVYKLKDK